MPSQAEIRQTCCYVRDFRGSVVDRGEPPKTAGGPSIWHVCGTPASLGRAQAGWRFPALPVLRGSLGPPVRGGSPLSRRKASAFAVCSHCPPLEPQKDQSLAAARLQRWMRSSSSNSSISPASSPAKPLANVIEQFAQFLLVIGSNDRATACRAALSARGWPVFSCSTTARPYALGACCGTAASVRSRSRLPAHPDEACPDHRHIPNLALPRACASRTLGTRSP
jgi:hypothetical protein